MPPLGWLLCLLSSLGGTAFALRQARRLALLDVPSERSNHRIPTPRGGGIGMMAVLTGVLTWLAWDDSAQRPFLLAALLGLVAVTGVGWADDHAHVSAGRRMAVHFVAAVLLALGAWLSGWPLWALVMVAVAVPVLVNVWNFMDGIDGIAATQAAIWGAVVAWSSPAGSVAGALSLGLAVACLGFLPFNFPRARVFMGDVASGGLGLLIAASGALLLVEAGHVDTGLPHVTAWVAPACALAPFLVDASLTLARRVLRGERWWEAHSQHTYQVLARRLGQHPPVTLWYAGLAVAGATAAVAFAHAGQFRAGGSQDFVIISFMFLWYICCAALWLRAQQLKT